MKFSDVPAEGTYNLAPKNITDIILKNKVNGKQLSEAVEIFYEAFERKIKPLIKSKETACEIYKKSINSDRVIYALLDDKVVGIAGLHYNNKNFMNNKYHYFREHFNPVKSFLIYTIYKWFSPQIKENELRIDTLAVKSTYRGMGIGSRLMKEVFSIAKNKGFDEVILEVVNTNPEAKRLYERTGFTVKKIVKYYFLTMSAGFTSEYIMSYKLKEKSDSQGDQGDQGDV